MEQCYERVRHEEFKRQGSYIQEKKMRKKMKKNFLLTETEMIQYGKRKSFNIREIRRLKNPGDCQRLRQYLELQKPKDLLSMTVDNMKQRYEGKTRKRSPAIDILVYWECRLNNSLDWGEPECFGCRQFGWSGQSGVKPFVWDNYFERAHIISARCGGPAEAWNTVYLCPWCHRSFDDIFMGYPWEYENQIEWLTNRREWVINQMMVKLKQSPNYRNLFKILADDDIENVLFICREQSSIEASYYANKLIKEKSIPFEVAPIYQFTFRQDYAINKLREKRNEYSNTTNN